MREIKFRAWDNFLSCYSRNSKELYYQANGIFGISTGDRYILEQYTGLKDKNGVEIYEGDIVRSWGGEYCQGYWEFDYKFEVKFDPEQWMYLTNMEHIEVIGNIYEASL